MSKTTKKYGKIVFRLKTTIDIKPVPTDRLKAEWKALDIYARKDYNKPYDALKDKDKAEIHFRLNAGIYNTEKAKEQKQQ
jgi:hypothetical protein